jgi:hypothetical protein
LKGRGKEVKIAGECGDILNLCLLVKALGAELVLSVPAGMPVGVLRGYRRIGERENWGEVRRWGGVDGRRGEGWLDP